MKSNCINERYNSAKAGCGHAISCTYTDKEDVPVSGILGEFFIQDINTGEILQDWTHNLIVTDFGRLLAALVKGHAGIAGAQYWEIGSGLVAWDSNPAQPSVSDTQLTTPLVRVPVQIWFLDINNNRISDPAIITNKLELEATFNESTGNGEWREFGIFGGNTSGALGSGIMCDKVIHPVIDKTANMSIIRRLRFTF